MGGYEDYGYTPHYCRAWSWSDETQTVLDSATTVEELRAIWRELEAAGKVDSCGGSEWHHALAHLEHERVRAAITRGNLERRVREAAAKTGGAS